MSEHHNDFGQPIGYPLEEWHERNRPPRSTMIGAWCRVEPLDPGLHSKELYEA